MSDEGDEDSASNDGDEGDEDSASDDGAVGLVFPVGVPSVARVGGHLWRISFTPARVRIAATSFHAFQWTRSSRTCDMYARCGSALCFDDGHDVARGVRM